MKKESKAELVACLLILAVIAMYLGGQPEIRSMWRTQTVAMAEASEDDRESGMDIGDPSSPSDEEVEFCVNNKRKFDEDFTTGGGEQGAYCRLLLKELPCDHDGRPDDPYEDVWGSEEWPDIIANGI